MDLIFNKPVPVENYWIQSAIPTKSFWIAWKVNKVALQDAGIFVEKTNEHYRVFRKLWYNPEQREFKPASVVSSFKINKAKNKLLNFQVPMVANLCTSLISNNKAIDGSDAGIGKTYHALATCLELNLRPAVVCTKTGISTWKKLITNFNLNPLFITNWESIIARKTKTGYKCSFPYITPVFNKYSNRLNYKWTIPEGNNNILLIFDEAHKGNGHNTSQGKVLLAARNYKLLLLTATLSESPFEFKNIGLIFNLFKEENFTNWLRTVGCYKSNYGDKWESLSSTDDMRYISKLIFPRFGGRLKKSEIEGFPDIQNIAQSYPIKDAKKFNTAFQNLVTDLTNNEKQKAKYMQERLSESQRKDAIDKQKLEFLRNLIQKAQANKLTLNLRYRQYTELLKVDLFIELIKEEIENGQSVAVFVNFTETLKVLAEKLKCSCLVYGEQTGKEGLNERLKSIENFQANKSRLIICNIAAGGIGISLHDLDGSYPRTAIISPTYSAKSMVQVLGRIHRSGAKSKAINKLIYASDTVEERVCESVSSKIDSINAFNDGDFAEKDIFNLMKGSENEVSQ